MPSASCVQFVSRSVCCESVCCVYRLASGYPQRWKTRFHNKKISINYLIDEVTAVTPLGPQEGSGFVLVRPRDARLLSEVVRRSCEAARGVLARCEALLASVHDR